MSNLVDISFTLNGQRITEKIKGDTTLLTYLRQIQGLTGAKQGCGKSQCGTCTVLVNGRPLKSCGIKLNSDKLQNAEIETIESLAPSDLTLHPIQEAFARVGAVQCGFCTPGMIMTVKGLLADNPDPSRKDIQTYLRNRNICRCTGYKKIFDAVHIASRINRGESVSYEEHPDDAPVRYSEAVLKTTGRLKYADDITWDDMLYGKVLFADRAPAVITGLDTSRAEALEGVFGIIRSDDIPGSYKLGMIERDQPALVGIGETIRSMADPIVAVFAETPEIALQALETIEVTYRDLPGVYNPDDAQRTDAPKVWEKRPDNVFYQGSIERGDIKSVLNESEVLVCGEFSTSRIAHGFMEPECGLAKPTKDGGVEIHYPTQSVFDDQIQVAEVLALPREKVRIIQLDTGGAFGGKEDVIFHHILGLAVLKFKRPVKITLTREESLQVSQKKHPMQFSAQLGLNRDGMFQGLEVTITADKGAYAALGLDIIENAMFFVGGPYYIPTVRINGKSVYTHNVMCGAMRGFGANQGNFVIESLVDMAAVQIGMDSFEIRLKNALKTGIPTITDHILEPGIADIEETLLAARKALARESAPEAAPGTKLGVGLACGIKNIGFGHGLPESAGAKVKLNTDGTCRLWVTHHEYGQGAAIGQARIASEVLGIPMEKIEVTHPDTKLTPYTGATTASRQTFLSGNATVGACRRLLSNLFEEASRRLDVLEAAMLKIDGKYVVVGNSDQKLPLATFGDELIAEFRAFPPQTKGFLENGEKSKFGKPEFANRRTHWAYAYGVQIAWVQVDKTTGKTKVLKVITISDVGRVLNPKAVEGQQEGGVVMGVGYGLTEQFKVENGRNLTKTLRQCGLPTAEDAPEIVTVTVENPHPGGPLGVKGFAEAPSLATAPAIANAIYDAIGVRVKDLPMTPERVIAGFNNKISGEKQDGSDYQKCTSG